MIKKGYEMEFPEDVNMVWVDRDNELEFLKELLYASSYDLYEVENTEEYLVEVLNTVNHLISGRIDEINGGEKDE